jgi:S-adenosylmethionine:diacylglycerol 3-amino-3-carboxypropyl transferase
MDSPWQAGRLTPGRRPQVMFGRMYEDHGVELDLFPPESRVLVIASAGDTAAALARAGHRVTAVDISATQLAYARARLAGGPTVTGTAERLMTLGRAAAAAAVPAWRPAAMTRFLRMAEPAEQARWWRRELDRPMLRVLMGAGLRPAGPLAGILRPGLRDVIPSRFDVVFRRRIAACVSRYPNATNPWAWRLLLGRERPGATPPEPIRGVEWVHADVVEHLRQAPAGRYDAVALSNVLDGPPPAFAARLHDALRHAVRPGGPVVLRSFHDRPPLAGRPLEDRSPLWGAVVAVETGG